MNRSALRSLRTMPMLLVMLCGHALAQSTTPLDSIEQEVLSSAGLQKCALVVEMFRAFEAQPDVGSIPIPDRYDTYFDECITIADSAGSLGLLNAIRIFKSALFTRNGKHVKVVELLNRVISSGHPLDSRDSLSTYVYLTGAYMGLELYDKALETAKTKYQVAESIGRTDVLATRNSEIAYVYYSLRVYGLAADYYRKVLEEYREIGDLYYVASHYNNVGLCFMRWDKPDTALAYFDTATTIVHELYGNQSQDPEKASFLELINGNKATVYYNQGKYDQAINIQEGGVKLNDQAEDRWGTLNSILLLSNAYRKKQDPAKALEYIDMAETLVKSHEMTNSSMQIQIGDIKARVLLDLGRFEESARLFKTINHLKDSIRSAQNRKTALISNSAYQVYQKENELVKQRANLIKSEAERAQGAQEKALFLFVSIGLLLVVILGLVLFRQKTRSNQLLASQKQEIEAQNLQIESNLDEKETLLKEIQHRVKNNLQVISGMLQLQTRNFDDPRMHEAMEEAQSRIKAMAIIHQQLYLNENNINYISFDKYLRNLTRQIAGAYRETSKKVTITIEAHGIEFNVDTAVPLGIMVNELVSNAFKYAFHETDAGTIIISIVEEGPNEYQLSVRDNGCGLPDNFNPAKNTSLGLKLVKILSKQMKGTFQFTSDHGTFFTISFKDNIAV